MEWVYLMITFIVFISYVVLSAAKDDRDYKKDRENRGIRDDD